MIDENGKPQNIWEDMMSVSKPRTHLLQKQKWEKTCKEGHWVWKICRGGRKPMNTNNPSSGWAICGSPQGRIYRVWQKNSLWNNSPPMNKNLQSQEQEQSYNSRKKFLSTLGPIIIFQTNWKIKKKLAKWNITVSDNDITIHVLDQMNESDWFSKDTMTRWEETNNIIIHGKPARSSSKKPTLPKNNTFMQKTKYRKVSTMS